MKKVNSSSNIYFQHWILACFNLFVVNQKNYFLSNLDDDMGFLGSRAPEAHRGYRQLNLTTLFLGRLPKRLTSTKCTFYFASITDNCPT